MLARPELEPMPDGLVRRRPDLVGTPRLEELLLAEREPHVRAEELVRRADEDVDVPSGDVDGAMRRVVDGIGPGEGVDRVRELDDPLHVRCRSDRVRGDGERDDARALGEEARDGVVVQLEVVGETCNPNNDAEVVRELEPG